MSVINERNSRIYLLSFVIVLLFSSLSLADFIDADAKLYALNGTNVTVRGFIRHDNSSGLNLTNVTCYLYNSTGNLVSNFNTTTNSSFSTWQLGYFELNLTSSNVTGRYNVTVNATLTNGTIITENIEIRVGNLANVTFNFTNRRPPFANGSYFELNISFSGKTSSAAGVPKLEIFNPNGLNSSGWVINNLTNRFEAATILYNITVPTTAEGRYVIIFDEGVGSVVFVVKSSLIAVANTEDTSNSTTTSFGQGETIKIEGKVRDENNAITNANVTAFITLPNGTVVSISLTHNLSGVDGEYGGTFNTSNFGGFSGDYKIEIVANASGKIVKSTSTATVQKLEGELGIVSDFFFDFGSQSAFRAGGPVEFNVLVFNLTNDVLLNGSTTTNTGSDVNCTAVRVVELRNVLNNSVEPSPTLTKSLGVFLGQNVCRIRFTAPSVDGVYSITVNASVGASQTNNLSVLATGYFAVQSYILKPSPILSIGGGFEFVSFLMPGDNATFELSVRNLSSNGSAVAGNLITSFNITKITPMSFTGEAASEIPASAITVLELTSGTSTTNPKVKFRVPDNRTGPFQAEFQATVDSRVIRGTAFYFARYVQGFVFPAHFGGGFGTGGGEGEGGFGEVGSFRCKGLQNFSASVFDVRTNQAAKGVVFNSIQEAREEHTGKDIRSLVSIASSSSTNSDGFGNLTINFSSAFGFSGFYFMLINVTTSDGKSDTLPGGFDCHRLSFFPNIQAVGSTGTGGFFVAPAAEINVSISSVKNLDTGNTTLTGTVNVVRLESFDPVAGPKFVPGPTATYTLVNGSRAFLLSPSNFSGLGSKWFNGWNMFVIQVCDNSTSPQTCDVQFGGFMVVAFDAFLDFSQPVPFTVTIGENVAYSIMARTNVSIQNFSIPSTGFAVQIGLPWEGSVVDATVVNATLSRDGWNNTNHTGFDNFERWNVTFTVPNSTRKGGNMIIIKVTNYLNETTEIMTFVSASLLTLTVPTSEGVFMTNFTINVSDPANSAIFFNNFKTNVSALNNLSMFNSTFSKSGFVCARINFTATRFGFFSQDVVYFNLTNSSVFLIDNATAGVYDVLVVNNSGKIAVATAANRSLASAGLGNLYFVKTEGCGFAFIINSNVNGTGFGAGWAGSHAVNSSVLLPILVKKGNAARANVAVNISQVLQQEDFGSSFGGFGFQGTLGTGQFKATQATTDGNGVAFLQVNISVSGFYSLIWNYNDSGTLDTAGFSQGIPIEIKSFNTEGGISQLPPRVLNLTKTNETGFYNATKSGNFFYLGNWSEASQGTLFSDTSILNHSIGLRNVTHVGPTAYTDIPGGLFTELVIDDDSHMCTNCTGDPSILRNNWTETFEASMSARLTVDGTSDASVDGSEGSVNLVFGNPSTFFDTFLANPTTSRNVTTNITVRACAFTFSQPRTPLIGANVSTLTTQIFTFSGSTTESLTVYDPYTNNVVTSVLTGPSGCATFNVSRSGGWTSGFGNEIKAKITSGVSTEDIFVGNVFVACPVSGPCF